MSSERLFQAIRSGDEARVRTILAGDPAHAQAADEQGIPAVLVALYHGQKACAAALADAHGPWTPADLPVAAALGDADGVARLLDAGAAVGARTPDGFTPLHLAAFFGRAEAARTLLARGADANAVADNPSRVRPIHSAAAAADAATLRLLVEHGAEVDAPQHGGWTALQAVAKRGAADCIAVLIDAGADPDKPADDGKTARDFGLPR